MDRPSFITNIPNRGCIGVGTGVESAHVQSVQCHLPHVGGAGVTLCPDNCPASMTHMLDKPVIRE